MISRSLPDRLRRAALAAVLLISSCRGGGADLVLRHGSVFTGRDGAPWAQAVAIDSGRIVFVGADSGAARFIGRRTEVVDLAGRLVMPGFLDTHAHPAWGGIELNECYLNDDTTAAMAIATVRRCAAAPDTGWLRGGGWALPLFPDANPHRRMLDSIVPDRPVYLAAEDGHSAWVNTAALRRAGISRATRDPANGRIERDAGGEPSGTLRESAMDLVARFLPAYSVDDYVEGIRRAQVLANQVGITGLYEASADSAMLAAYRRLDSAGQLTVRVRAAIEIDPALGEEGVGRAGRLRRQFAGRFLRAEAAKIFLDGVIEARTAAMLEPYRDRPGDRGTLNVAPEALARLVTALDRDSFQVHIHAIGDRAVRVALDAVQRARDANGPRDARHMITHLEVINPADLPRFKTLGVIASFQPLWAQADPYIVELTLPALGPERSSWIYPIGSVERSGAVVAGASDWTVSSLNPLDAMQVAVTRRGVRAGPGEPFIEAERVRLNQIAVAYTRDAALAFFLERETGTLEPGKSADLVVLDRDIFTGPAEAIHEARVDRTVLEGRTVYSRTPGQ